MSQTYTEGSPVKAGDVLFQVDPRPSQTAVDQAVLTALREVSDALLVSYVRLYRALGGGWTLTDQQWMSGP
jgi:multidrug efflux pump subunit AcrA (membrane-fusion protein)